MKRIFIRLASGLFLVLSSASCLHVKEKPDDSELAGNYHVVKPGDTLPKLAQKYRVSVAEIIETNGIVDEHHLRLGQALFMPDPDPIGKKIAYIKQKSSTKKTSAQKNKQTTVEPGPHAHLFDFPVPGGTIIYRFSKAKDKPYDGIGIKAPLGTEIISPHDGRVLFVGNDGTKFGLLVIIEHQEPFITVYAHLHQAKVTTGQLLKRGQPLGTVGKSGGVSLPHLHFQIRVKERPQNPVPYLKIPNAP